MISRRWKKNSFYFLSDMSFIFGHFSIGKSALNMYELALRWFLIV